MAVKGVGVREALMLLYALVWAVLMVVTGIRSGQWPPPETWGGLGLGIGALMFLFAGEEAARRRRDGNGHSNGHANGGGAKT